MTDGLVEMLPGDHYNLIGAACCPHHPVNHFGTGQFVTALQSLASSFFEEYGEPLEYNDMSLVGGGIFDLRQNFMGPHSEHRIGTNVDLRTKTLTTPQLKFVWIEWGALGGSVHDETKRSDGTPRPPAEGPHYHLRF